MMHSYEQAHGAVMHALECSCKLMVMRTHAYSCVLMRAHACSCVLMGSCNGQCVVCSCGYIGGGALTSRMCARPFSSAMSQPATKKRKKRNQLPAAVLRENRRRWLLRART